MLQAKHLSDDRRRQLNDILGAELLTREHLKREGWGGIRSILPASLGTRFSRFPPSSGDRRWLGPEFRDEGIPTHYERIDGRRERGSNYSGIGGGLGEAASEFKHSALCARMSTSTMEKDGVIARIRELRTRENQGGGRGRGRV